MIGNRFGSRAHPTTGELPRGPLSQISIYWAPDLGVAPDPLPLFSGYINPSLIPLFLTHSPSIHSVTVL